MNDPLEYFIIIWPVVLLSVIAYATWSLITKGEEMDEKEFNEKSGLMGLGIIIGIVLFLAFLESIDFLDMVGDFFRMLFDNIFYILLLVIIGLLGAITFFLAQISKKQ